ncbi:MAG: hypothetical protein JXQ90_07955 [Cyclobacteriaceae bacterium]
MKNGLKIAFLATLLMLFINPAIAGGNDEEKSIEDLRKNIETAVESRNFHDAKILIDELMPLMKKDIKKSKKTLSHLKKEDDPQTDPGQFAEELKRKEELLDAMKSLVGISPAAMRVKASSLVKMVNEFSQLADNS